MDDLTEILALNDKKLEVDAEILALPVKEKDVMLALLNDETLRLEAERLEAKSSCLSAMTTLLAKETGKAKPRN